MLRLFQTLKQPCLNVYIIYTFTVWFSCRVSEWQWSSQRLVDGKLLSCVWSNPDSRVPENFSLWGLWNQVFLFQVYLFQIQGCCHISNTAFYATRGKSMHKGSGCTWTTKLKWSSRAKNVEAYWYVTDHTE